MNKMKPAVAAPAMFLLGAFALTGAPSAAQNISTPPVQLAQIVTDQNKKPAAPAAPHAAPVKPVARPMQPRVNQPAHVNAPVRTGPRVVTPAQTGPRVVAPNKGSVLGTTAQTGPKVISRGAGGPGTVKAFTPRGPNSRVVTMSRLRGFPAQGVGHTAIRGHDYSVWRGERRFHYRGGWRTFVTLSALGALAIAGAEYYPYAYVSAPAPYCDGLTEDGCQLVWQDVETVEGDIIPQCVAYCPWQ